MKREQWVYLMLIALFVSLLKAQDISGKVYFDYTYHSAKDAVNGFGLKRVYLTVEKGISENIDFTFKTDIDYKNSPKNIYLKNAKVDWKTHYGKIVLGLQGMNMFNIQEKTWGYRFIEKSPMDLHNYSSSADMGVGYYYSFGKLLVNGLFTNGSGYKRSESDSHKKLSIQTFYGQKNLPSNNGFNMGTVFSYEPYDSDPVTVESTAIIGIFGGFADRRIRIGGEYNRKTDSAKNNDKNTITSLYGQYKFNSNIFVFGRFDTVKNDGSENYIITGVSYNPAKGLRIAPNFRKKGNKVEYVINFLFKY